MAIQPIYYKIMLCLVIALLAEARPLISHARLKKIDGHPYRLYEGEQLRLIVSGIGKVAAGSAVAYQQALLEEPIAAWLNVGVAGHHSEELGSALLAYKVIDEATDKTFYPTFSSPPPCDTTQLITVDQVQGGYPDHSGVDMEASGFCATAQRFTSSELVHCLKVVSDNPQSTVSSLDEKKISRLIEEQLDLVDEFTTPLQDLSAELASLRADPPYFAELLERWQFTVTQQHQLRDLLIRWQTLTPANPIPVDDLQNLKHRADVLVQLQNQLDQTTLVLTSTESRQ